MQVFFTAKRLNIFCCHNPHRKRPEFQVGSIRYWWIRVFRQILHAQTFKCFIYNIHLLFINMQLWWITGNTTSWYSNPVWLLGLRLILCFAGLEVRVEAVPTECQYFQTAKRVANGVIFHPLCSVETPLTVLRWSIFFFFFLRIRIKTSTVSSVFNFQFSKIWISSFGSLDFCCLVLGDMILEGESDSTDVVDVSKPWI